MIRLLAENPVWDAEELQLKGRSAARHPPAALQDVMEVGGRIIALSWNRNMLVDEEGYAHEDLEELAVENGVLPRGKIPLLIVLQKRDLPLSDRIDRIEFHRRRPDGRGWFTWEKAIADPESYRLIYDAFELLDASGAVAEDAEWYWTHGGTFFNQRVSPFFRELAAER